MEWEWSRYNREGLASFVTDKAVEFLRLPENRVDIALSQGRYQLVEAIYNALVEQNIRYTPEKYHPSNAKQRIRTPVEILDKPGEGTCLDLAALFCGLCLGNDLLPLLIVTEGHALAAVSLTHGLRDWNIFNRRERELFKNKPLEDVEQLRELIVSDVYIAIECTGFAYSKSIPKNFPEGVGRTEDGILPIERAIAAGHEQLNQTDRPFRFALDIAVAHYEWRIESANIPNSNFVLPSSPLHQFQSLIADKTEGFVGRVYVFSAIAEFINSQLNGYFTIEADPGVGKSAILAKYVQEHDCIAHFNVRLQSINRASQFLESVCKQLINRYDLPYPSLPTEATRDGNFLAQLLDEVSPKLAESRKLVIAIDALDEVDLASQDVGANILYLPPSLPQGVYFLLTRRRVTLPFVVHAPQHLFKLMEYRDQSRQDVQNYIWGATRRPKLQAWIDRREMTVEEFVNQLADKSENNFMYLRYVLPQIEDGFYQDLSIESLPKGLEGYYEDHWRRMGMAAKPLPRTKLKIVYILGEIRQPVSRRLISEYASEDQLTVQNVLDEWEQFLHEQPIDDQTCYSIYHSSFQDFLHRKDIVQAAGIDIKNINAMIADRLWEGLFGDE
ncbi:hypothetical protein H6G27_26135 [Nostoc linckia FACHB-104]|nr:hypothetical protein [Nostoc linckia FACHB-104]